MMVNAAILLIVMLTGDLFLSDIIEIGEYAHFSFLAWNSTDEIRFKDVGLKLNREGLRRCTIRAVCKSATVMPIAVISKPTLSIRSSQHS